VNIMECSCRQQQIESKVQLEFDPSYFSRSLSVLNSRMPWCVGALLPVEVRVLGSLW